MRCMGPDHRRDADIDGGLGCRRRCRADRIGDTGGRRTACNVAPSNDTERFARQMRRDGLTDGTTPRDTLIYHRPGLSTVLASQPGLTAAENSIALLR